VSQRVFTCTNVTQDREPEPRFTGGPSRGDFGGGGRGGFGGGGGGGYGGGAGGRQLYVSNVCSPSHNPGCYAMSHRVVVLTPNV
jgi:hypothetical protein